MAYKFEFDFIGKRNIAFGISIASVVIFWAWVFASGGLRYGIDFTGGIQHIFKFNRTMTADLVGQIREAALEADPSAQVQNIGKPDEGEVMIQVKGFELVEKITAEISSSPVTTLDDLKSRLAKFDVLDTGFYAAIGTAAESLERKHLVKSVSDYVGEATGRRLTEKLGDRFGNIPGKTDLNRIPVSGRLFAQVQAAAVRRTADAILQKISTAKSMQELAPIFQDAGLDFRPFDEKFLLRAPTLEEIKTDLHEVAGQPDRIGKLLLEMYPNAFRDEFMPAVDRIIANKETRGLYDSIDDASKYAEGPKAGLMKEIMAESFYTSPFVLIKTDQVSSRIGAELRQKALLVISLSLLVMGVYIWVRFQFRFGIGAAVTLIHDSLTIIPLMSVLGYEYDINLIAAILTLIGYSLNDTIVVYDRIRENLAGMRGADLKNVINTSITQTLSRTVVTGITSLLAVLSLYFLGGPVLEGFSLALFIGIIVGTYSSIFVSAPVVYLWPTKK